MKRAGIGFAAAVAALVLCATGCHGGASPRSATPAASPAATAGPSTTSALSTGPTNAPGLTDTTSAATPAGPAALGNCHARGSGLYVLPDHACTPGASNPGVTQGDIDETICRSGWTATVRPPESYTEPLKYQQMAAYGDTGSAREYEEDHLIPLELGGSPTSPLNLWPEPGAAPNPKDSVEDTARRAVCDGQMTLSAAQQAIAVDWVSFGRQLGVVQAPPPSTGTPPPGQAATCTATASYSTRYGDWDIYLHSDQPDQSVTVTTGGGATASWHTDSSGYADVYLHAPQSAGGQVVTVTAGRASCSTTL